LKNKKKQKNLKDRNNIKIHSTPFYCFGSTFSFDCVHDFPFTLLFYIWFQEIKAAATTTTVEKKKFKK
jgi:hypothetical protein